MPILSLITIFLVLLGALFMSAAILRGRMIYASVPPELLRRWRVLVMFMLCFLAGYVFLILILAEQVAFPIELLTGGVFLGGAIFVFIVINLSSETINKISTAEEELRLLNDYLEQRVVERTRELQSSQEFLRTVLHSLNDEVIIIDTVDFKILDANASFLNAYQLTAEAVIGRTCHEVTHHRTEMCTPPDDSCPLLETLSTGKFAVVEHTHRDESGNKLYVEVSTTPIRALDGRISQIVHISKDISERKRSEQALRESEEQYRRLVELSPDGIALVVDSAYVFVNAAGYRLLGVTEPCRILGKPFVDAFHPDSKERVMQRIQQLAHQTGSMPWQEEKILRFDGREVEVELAGVPFSFAGKPAMQIIFRDISDRKQIEERLKRLALYDELTGLPNRSLFYDRVRQLLEMAKRNHYILALLYIDLDRFKQVNDTLGHEMGDLLLKEVSRRLTSVTRKADTVARIGGDEFVGICGKIEASGDATVIARKISDVLSQPFFLRDNECTIGASIGISLYPEDGEDMETLLNKADAAMYQVKQNRKGGYLLYRDLKKD